VRWPRSNGTSSFAAYRAAFPELAAEFERRMQGELPAAWAEARDAAIAKIVDAAQTIATRKASQTHSKPSRPACPSLSAARPT
jgi:transketolase